MARLAPRDWRGAWHLESLMFLHGVGGDLGWQAKRTARNWFCECRETFSETKTKAPDPVTFAGPPGPPQAAGPRAARPVGRGSSARLRRPVPAAAHEPAAALQGGCRAAAGGCGKARAGRSEAAQKLRMAFQTAELHLKPEPKASCQMRSPLRSRRSLPGGGSAPGQGSGSGSGSDSGQG